MLSIPQIEQKVLKFWKDQNIFQKVLAKESPKGDFVFYEGPPTANGAPGVHHILSRAYKDVIPRFKTMQGHRVRRKAGWDTQGLPVELEVEKRLGLKSKREIEAYGIEKFNEECKKSVWQYKDLWEQFTERMGFWVDMEHPYITYTNEYIESLWWIVKQFWEKGLLYQGHKVVPHCPRCGTALSSHEVALGYKIITDQSVIVKFPISNFQFSNKKGNEKVFLLAWTTTPWTLPGNVALAVGKDIDYVIFEKIAGPDIRTSIGEQIIFAEGDIMSSRDVTYFRIFGGDYYSEEKKGIIETSGGEKYERKGLVKGKDLVGLEYEPLFDSLKDVPEKKHYVTTADFVSTEEGTGVVHTAVMYGEDDYQLGEKIGLPKVHTVNEDGTFNERVPQWQGKFVKDVEKDITQDLQKRGLLLRVVEYEHEYPFCWRCSTPLLYYAKLSWFVNMSSLREQLIQNNQQINWVPAYIKEGRFGEWLKEVKDWAFSRERYWGTPLPVWRCQTGKSQIPNPKSQTNSNDQIQNSKQGCGNIKIIGSVKELEELSGKRLEDLHKPFIDEIEFPCEQCGGTMKRVPEVCDAWFDSGAMPFAQHHYPFENKELIDRGEEFPADYIAEAIDQTRGWFYTLLAVSTALGRGVPFKNVICLGHILDKNGLKMSKSKGNVVDPWDMFQKYGADPLRYYLYSMNDAGLPKRFNEDELKDISNRVFGTLFNVVSFYKLFSGERKIEDLEANDLTHILDHWINMKLNELIRAVTSKLEEYDVTSASRAVGEFVNELSVWYVRRSRERFKSENENEKLSAIKTLRHVIFNVTRLLAPFTPSVAEYIYSREMEGIGGSVHLRPWPEPYLPEKDDPNVLQNMETIRKIVSLALEQRAKNNVPVRQPLQRLTVNSQQSTDLKEEYLELIKDEVNVKEVVTTTGLKDDKGEELSVELDLTISEELKKEGLVREITRLVNDLRKKQGLTIHDRVTVLYQGDQEVEKVIEEYREQLERATLAKGWELAKNSENFVRLPLKTHSLSVLLCV